MCPEQNFPSGNMQSDKKLLEANMEIANLKRKISATETCLEQVEIKHKNSEKILENSKSYCEFLELKVLTVSNELQSLNQKNSATETCLEQFQIKHKNSEQELNYYKSYCQFLESKNEKVTAELQDLYTYIDSLKREKLKL